MEALPAGLDVRRLSDAIRRMTVHVSAIRDKLYGIRTPFKEGGTVFLYLLTGDTAALIDTGAAYSPREVIEPALAEIGMALSDVDLILNTHAHLDHAGGNLAAKRASRASIHVHSADLFMANSTEAQVEFMNAPLRALDFSEEAIRKRGEYVVENAGEAAGADVLLSEGGIVDLGDGVKLRVVHCPGHTPGSVAYYWELEGVLLTGDAVQGQGSRPGEYPLYFNASDYRRSLETLARLEYRLLCLGHAYLGGSLVNNPVRNAEEGEAFFREAMRVADLLQGAVEGAIRRRPDASKREIALEALSETVYQLPTLLARETQMPRSGGPTLHAHIEAALSGSYPA